MKKQGIVLFAKRPKIGPMTLWPMSGGRVAILEEKGNRLVTGTGGGEASISRFELFEAFFVAASSEDELVPMMSAEDREWKNAVNGFSLGEAGDLVDQFAEVVRAEFERITAMITEPKKKAATRASRRK